MIILTEPLPNDVMMTLFYNNRDVFCIGFEASPEVLKDFPNHFDNKLIGTEFNIEDSTIKITGEIHHYCNSEGIESVDLLEEPQAH